MNATIELAPLWDLFVALFKLAADLVAGALIGMGFRDDRRAERNAFRGHWGAANFERLGAISHLLAAGFLLVMLNV